MLKSIIHLAQQPSPVGGSQAPLRYATVAGGVVAAVLFLLRPEGLSQVAQGMLLAVCVGYGLVTFVCMLIIDAGLVALFPRAFAEENWTVWKDALTNVLRVCLIALANYLFEITVWPQPFQLVGLLNALGYTASVALVPLSILQLLRQVYWLNRNLQEAQKLNSHLHAPSSHPANGQPQGQVSIVLEEAGPLAWQPEELLLVAAADNYVEFYWQRGGQLKKDLLRGSLKNVEAELAAWPQYLRCHRSYVANLALVQAVRGNSQGYRLALPLGQEVPVSRSYADVLQARIQVLQAGAAA